MFAAILAVVIGQTCAAQAVTWQPVELEFFVSPSAFEQLVDIGKISGDDSLGKARGAFADYWKRLQALDEATTHEIDAAGRAAANELTKSPGARERPDFKQKVNELFAAATEVYLARSKESDARAWALVSQLEALAPPSDRAAFQRAAPDILQFECWRLRCAKRRAVTGYGNYVYDADLLSVLRPNLLNGGCLEEVASDERLVTAKKAIELEMDQFRSTVAAISRRQSALGRLPVNQRGQRDSDGIPVALKEYKKSRASVALANRQLIEGIHRALVDVGRPDLSFRWLQIALKETMPLVKRSGDWPKSVLEWASERGGLEPAALEALAAECAAFESRRWALLKALSTATIDLFVAEQTGIERVMHSS